MFIEITPVAKPRMVRGDKWKKRPCVLKYRTFCDEIRLKHPKSLPQTIDLIFYMPMPKSWSKKKIAQMHLNPHQAKPDIDNLIKSVLDALCADDSYIWSIKATKLWTNETPGIEISI